MRRGHGQQGPCDQAHFGKPLPGWTLTDTVEMVRPGCPVAGRQKRKIKLALDDEIKLGKWWYKQLHAVCRTQTDGQKNSFCCLRVLLCFGALLCKCSFPRQEPRHQESQAT